MVSLNTCIVCESLAVGNGGICRVARLMARVVQEEVRASRLNARAVVLSDEQVPFGLDLRVTLTGASRMRFLWEVQRAALNHSHFIYDFVGMARAHCRLPLLRRPFLTWIHGIEVWEGDASRSDRLGAAGQCSGLEQRLYAGPCRTRCTVVLPAPKSAGWPPKRMSCRQPRPRLPGRPR